MHAVRGALLEPPPSDPTRAVFRVLKEDGSVEKGRSELAQLSRQEAHRLFHGMLRIRIMDERLLAMQRQGRIGFYAEIKGQEASTIGSAAALSDEDWLVPALREAGAGLFRGLTMRHYVAQIFGNDNDVSRGHQLPCHPGTRASRYVTMSSCIASQLPHAVGIAWAAKLRSDPVVVLGCLGDGATSEEDFHVAANFAGVFAVPVVFFCSNNQWAISTPSSVQTAAPSFAIKALAYGMPGIRVDGNDILAVKHVVGEAVARARAGGGPTLVEALTYRVAAHTSSDDPSRYRDESVTEMWKTTRDPIERFRRFLTAKKLLTVDEEAAMRQETENELRDAISVEEAAAPPPLRSLIEDVFAEVPQFLVDELAEIEPLPRQKTGGVHA